jgi:hypothetical protein
VHPGSIPGVASNKKPASFNNLARFSARAVQPRTRHAATFSQAFSMAAIIYRLLHATCMRHKWRSLSWVSAIKTKTVIKTTDNEEGRTGYVAVFRVDNVQIDENGLVSFDLVERLAHCR